MHCILVCSLINAFYSQDLPDLSNAYAKGTEVIGMNFVYTTRSLTCFCRVDSLQLLNIFQSEIGCQKNNFNDLYKCLAITTIIIIFSELIDEIITGYISSMDEGLLFITADLSKDRLLNLKSDQYWKQNWESNRHLIW